MTEDEFRDLLEMSHQISELTRQPGWQYLIDRASVNLGAKQKQLLNGQVDSMEKYRETAGFLKGADFVLRLPEIVAAEVQSQRELIREVTDAERDA